eukprot:TRINITY_DN947_c0_g1_i1.p1 TRINITY_DN947_c0_g1~~TRINITY_DN947_c0_g1_i1.p1  ORF type:complete len:377 (-),score=137.94 TRINITY_DN947_c0_g1_i1:65-1195(-)
MTTKQKFGLESIKKGVMRTKQKVAEKFSGAQKTVDIQYDQEWSRFKQHDELISKMKKIEVEYLAAIRKLVLQENKLATDVCTVFNSNDELYQASQENKSMLFQIEKAREEMEAHIQRDFLDPLTLYLRQFGVLKQRNDERSRRLIDMDRYRHDYKKGLEKGDSGKASSNKKKFYGMKKAYELLNSEMLLDLPLLIRDKDQFFSPLFATHVKATSEFFQKAAEIMNKMWEWLMHINKENIHSYSSVITDEEQSCWNKQIDLVAAVETNDIITRGNAPPQNNNNNYNQPPPQQTYNQPPPQQNFNQQQPMRPPPPRNNQPRVPQAKALYPFQGQDSNELSFNVGDVITLVDAQEGADWWTGELNGYQGLIPSNYVQRI